LKNLFERPYLCFRIWKTFSKSNSKLYCELLAPHSKIEGRTLKRRELAINDHHSRSWRLQFTTHNFVVRTKFDLQAALIALRVLDCTKGFAHDTTIVGIALGKKVSGNVQ